MLMFKTKKRKVLTDQEQAAIHAVEMMGNVDPNDFKKEFIELNSLQAYEDLKKKYPNLLPKE